MPILKRSIKRLKRLLTFRRFKPKSAADIITQSGKFNAQWYLHTYPDVAANAYWAANPLQHFMLYGGAENRQPTAWFDTKWYKQQYPDVAASGVNPLLHYIQHGAKEGRKPNRHKFNKSKKYKGKDPSDIRGRLALHLWGGLSGPALAALQQAYNNTALAPTERWSACWHASRWYYFIGDFEHTLALGKLLLQLDPNQALRKEGVLLRSFCHLALNRPDAARPELQAFIAANPQDADGYFTLANTFLNNDEKRLSLINGVFTSHGYAPLSLVDPSQPLALSNITASAPAVADTAVKVSVIMPVYNAGQHLHIAVNSLLKQSWQNIEIIIVDDCSPDDTYALAKQLAQQDARIVVLQQPVNSGAYAARNAGLKIANGDFITTHDSDDWSHPQKLATQLQYFVEHPQMMGLCTHWIRVKPNMFFTQNWRPNNALTHWSQSSFMFRREVVNELGGWDEVRVGGDTEFIWRVKARYGLHSYQQIHPEVPLAFALDDQSSLTRTKATHVRTVYFGLRNIYREICAWWHSTAPDLHIDHKQGRKTFPIPVGMQYRDGRCSEVDILLVSDFSNAKMSDVLLSLVQCNPTIQFGLLHWPDFTAVPSGLTQHYFQTIAKYGALPVTAGEQVKTKHIVTAAVSLLQNPVDSVPELLTKPDCWLLVDGELPEFDIPQMAMTSELKLADVATLLKELQLKYPA